MEDLLKFKKMITPVIIQILFWIGVAVCVVIGAKLVIKNAQYGVDDIDFITGVLWLVLGPIALRIYAELLIVIFSINDTLTELKNSLKQRGQ